MIEQMMFTRKLATVTIAWVYSGLWIKGPAVLAYTTMAPKPVCVGMGMGT